AAAAVVGRADADELLHAVVPPLGKVLGLEAAEEQLLLETESKDDVEPVRGLVRVHREAVAELRVEPAPERERAPDHVLPEPALRLVQGGRAAGRERRPVERCVAAS